jgi:hypothetical protein
MPRHETTTARFGNQASIITNTNKPSYEQYQTE